MPLANPEGTVEEPPVHSANSAEAGKPVVYGFRGGLAAPGPGARYFNPGCSVSNPAPTSVLAASLSQQPRRGHRLVSEESGRDRVLLGKDHCGVLRGGLLGGQGLGGEGLQCEGGWGSGPGD